MKSPIARVLVPVSLFVVACGGSSSGGKVTDATGTGDATSTSDATSTTDASSTTDATTSTGPDIVRLDTTTGGDTTSATCKNVTLSGTLTYYEESAPEEDFVAFILGAGEDFGFGGALPDLLWIEFYADVDQTGTYDLGSAGENDNYATCVQCVSAFVDVDNQAGDYESDLFQVSGTLTVAAGSAPSTQKVTITLTNLKLEEVTFDEEDLTSTPVPGGACYTVTSPVTLETP